MPVFEHGKMVGRVRLCVNIDDDVRSAIGARAAAEGRRATFVIGEALEKAFEPELKAVRSARGRRADVWLRPRGGAAGRQASMTIWVDPDNGRVVIEDSELATKLFLERCRPRPPKFIEGWTRRTIAAALLDGIGRDASW